MAIFCRGFALWLKCFHLRFEDHGRKLGAAGFFLKGCGIRAFFLGILDGFFDVFFWEGRLFHHSLCRFKGLAVRGFDWRSEWWFCFLGWVFSCVKVRWYQTQNKRSANIFWGFVQWGVGRNLQALSSHCFPWRVRRDFSFPWSHDELCQCQRDCQGWCDWWLFGMGGWVGNG